VSNDLIERLRNQMCNRRNEQDCGCPMCDMLSEATAELCTLRAERGAAVQAEVAAIVAYLRHPRLWSYHPLADAIERGDYKEPTP